jgi:hypothetical protein
MQKARGRGWKNYFHAKLSMLKGIKRASTIVGTTRRAKVQALWQTEF